MPNPNLLGLGILAAMGYPEGVNLPEVGFVFKVDEKLSAEYLKKFLQCAGWETPFLTESFQWRAAEPMLRMGYRDYELSFGDTWSLNKRAIPHGSKGFYFIKITTKLSDKTRERRMQFRRFWPYKWVQRAWPFACIDAQRWWHYIWPFISKENLSPHADSATYIACRWQRKPTFIWGQEAPAPVLPFRARGSQPPIDTDALHGINPNPTPILFSPRDAENEEYDEED